MIKDLFRASKEERAIIAKIAHRYVSLCKGFGVKVKPLDIEMDIEATHCNGCPLRLQDLLEADDFNLVHDVSGIFGHLNRENGKLERLFLPRFHA